MPSTFPCRDAVRIEKVRQVHWRATPDGTLDDPGRGTVQRVFFGPGFGSHGRQDVPTAAYAVDTSAPRDFPGKLPTYAST